MSAKTLTLDGWICVDDWKFILWEDTCGVSIDLFRLKRDAARQGTPVKVRVTIEEIKR
jgi:hypothetical protein